MCHSRPILTVVAVLAGIMLLAGFLAAPAQAELSWFGGGKPPGFITNPPSPGTMFCPINSPGYITEKPKPCQENTEEQRFRRIKLALEKQESGGADCATNGGCKARTANPFMPTSYGWTHLTIGVLFDKTKQLVKNDSGKEQGEVWLNTQQALREQGITEEQMSAAQGRFVKAQEWWKKVSYASDPDKMPADYQKETGLDAAAWKRLVYWKKIENLLIATRKAGKNDPAAYYKSLTPQQDKDLASWLKEVGMKRGSQNDTGFDVYIKEKRYEEAKYGYFATAIFAGDEKLRDAVIKGIYQNKARYDSISDPYIKWNIKKTIQRYPQKSGEKAADYELRVAKMVGYAHNYGIYQGGDLDKIGYVTQFAEKWKKVNALGVAALCGK